jgi:hypothetical protein
MGEVSAWGEPLEFCKRYLDSVDFFYASIGKKRLLEEEGTFRVIGLVVWSLRERPASSHREGQSRPVTKKERKSSFFYMTRMCGEFVVDHSRGKDS